MGPPSSKHEKLLLTLCTIFFLFWLQLHTDLDVGGKNIKYVLAGEGAGTIFAINELTGDIHAMKRLDREEKAEYTLTAQVINADTDEPLEPPSEFIIKVQDINDNPPQFIEGPYRASVPEMSAVGESQQTVFLLSTTQSSLISVRDFRDGWSLMGYCMKIMSKQEQEEMSRPIYMLACNEYFRKWKHKNDESNRENFTHYSGVSVHTLLIRLGNAKIAFSSKKI